MTDALALGNWLAQATGDKWRNLQKALDDLDLEDQQEEPLLMEHQVQGSGMKAEFDFKRHLVAGEQTGVLEGLEEITIRMIVTLGAPIDCVINEYCCELQIQTG